jgi:hypothetical protein
VRSRLSLALRLFAACTLILAIVFCQVAQPLPPLDKHSRKIQSTLASYPAGSTVLIEMHDRSQVLGVLGTLSASTFELVPRKGAVLNLAYTDVDRVQKAESQTGSVIVVRHHNGLIAGLILAGAIAGFLVFAVVELKKS